MNLRLIFRVMPRLLIVAVMPALPVRGQDWALTSVPVADWTSVACSADGSRVFAACTGQSFPYVSTDGGRTWTAQTAAGHMPWVAVACSSDGVKLAAANNTQYVVADIYTSADVGTNWIRRTPFAFWRSLASSSDGGRLLAVGSYLHPHGLSAAVYSTTDSGESWTQADIPDGIWTCAACSADGTNLVAAARGPVFTSTNAGAAWIQSDAPAQAWAGVACSADGMRMVAAAQGAYDLSPGGTIYLSGNSGATWTPSNAPTTNWQAVASSADGTVLVAVAGGRDGIGPIYMSTDGGVAWSPCSAPATNWTAVTSSADGCRLVATVHGGEIYTWQTTPKPVLRISASSTGLLLSWIVPSMEFALQETSDLAAPNWTDVAASPALNYTNLHYEVHLPQPPGPRFYRLASKP